MQEEDQLVPPLAELYTPTMEVQKGSLPAVMSWLVVKSGLAAMGSSFTGEKLLFEAWTTGRMYGRFGSDALPRPVEAPDAGVETIESARHSTAIDAMAQDAARGRRLARLTDRGGWVPTGCLLPPDGLTRADREP